MLTSDKDKNRHNAYLTRLLPPPIVITLDTEPASFLAMHAYSALPVVVSLATPVAAMSSEMVMLSLVHVTVGGGIPSTWHCIISRSLGTLITRIILGRARVEREGGREGEGGGGGEISIYM